MADGKIQATMALSSTCTIYSPQFACTVWMINWKSVFSFVLGDLACHYRLFATRGKLW